jgi:atypical dual specificity phosphatase
MGQWWIAYTIILGSCNPTTAQLDKLYRAGFRTIISLLNEKQQPPRYDIRRIKAIGFKRYSIPITDGTAPAPARFKKFIEIVKRTSVTAKVLVHCQGGSGRTGTMAAAYWIHKGLPSQEAIEKVRDANPTAVENPKQEKSPYRFGKTIKSKNLIHSSLAKKKAVTF